MTDAETIMNSFFAEVAGERQESLDHLVANLSPEERDRLTRHARDDNERMQFYFLVGPVLNALSHEERTAVFEYVDGTSWGNGVFDEGGRDWRSIHRLAAAMIPVAEVLKLPEAQQERYKEMADIRRGYSSDDLTKLFRPIHTALQSLEDPEDKKRYFEALSEIQKRDLDAGRVASGVLRTLRAHHSWEVIERDYVKPLTSIHGHDSWFAVPGNLAWSLQEIVGRQEDVLFVQDQLQESDHRQSHLARKNAAPSTLAQYLPSVLAIEGITREEALRYVDFVKSIAHEWGINFYSSHMVDALAAVDPEERGMVFDYAAEREGQLHHRMYSLVTGARAYACEGFAAFERRRQLATKVNAGEEDIGNWILYDAEKILRHGEEAAHEYVNAMRPLQSLSHADAREVFKWATEMVRDKKRTDYPEKVLPLAALCAYQQLDHEGRRDALRIFRDLYWADVKDGSSRTNLFVAAARRIDQESRLGTKAFLRGGTGDGLFPITAILGVETPCYEKK